MYSHANWKNTDKWSLTCFKNILKISHSNYASFCSNLPMKFAIFFKSSLLFNSFYCLFLLLNKTLRLNNLKTRTATNAKISVFVICVEVIIYLLLCNLHDFTFNYFYHCSVRAVRFMLVFFSDRIGCFFIGNC